MLQKSLVKIYEESFKENWDLPALTDYPTGETITYGQLAERIAVTHQFFRQLNVQPGAKIAICGRDSSDWVVTYMAVITYGAVIVPYCRISTPSTSPTSSTIRTPSYGSLPTTSGNIYNRRICST